jgi:hypothetical protein
VAAPFASIFFFAICDISLVQQNDFRKASRAGKARLVEITGAAICHRMLALIAIMRPPAERYTVIVSSYPCCSPEDVAMRNEFWDEIGDTLFVAAIAVAIGVVAANLAIQVNKERAAFDAASQQVGQLVDPLAPSDAGTGAEKILPAS